LWFKCLQIRPDPLVKVVPNLPVSSVTSLYYPFGYLD
jgi:hypothetical protein